MCFLSAEWAMFSGTKVQGPRWLDTSPEVSMCVTVNIVIVNLQLLSANTVSSSEKSFVTSTISGEGNGNNSRNYPYPPQPRGNLCLWLHLDQHSSRQAEETRDQVRQVEETETERRNKSDGNMKTDTHHWCQTRGILRSLTCCRHHHCHTGTSSRSRGMSIQLVCSGHKYRWQSHRTGESIVNSSGSGWSRSQSGV